VAIRKRGLYCRAAVRLSRSCWRLTVSKLLGGPIQSRIWSIERRHFQWPWTTATPGFKVTPFFDAEYLRNGTRYKRDLHTPYSTVSFRMTKYSMTWSIARPLCDDRATCFCRCRHTLLRFAGPDFTTWGRYVHSVGHYQQKLQIH